MTVAISLGLPFGPKVVDLSHPYCTDMAKVEPHGAPEFTSSPHQMCGSVFTIGKMTMSSHTGTHIDLPRHLIAGSRTLDDFEVGDFVGSAIVLDVRREGAVELSADELESADIRSGDFVLLYFGYASRFGSDEYRTVHPYLTNEAAQFLVDRGVRMVGFDLQTPDRPSSLREPDFTFPAHQILLGAGCLILENLGPALAQLVGQRVILAAAPLRLPGADGSPVRPIAWPIDNNASS